MNEITYHGREITTPGLYAGLPIERYHSDCCVGPSISSSGLRAILSDSPAAYWRTSYLNPAREEREGGKHFDIGQAAHHLILGEGSFAARFVVTPAKAPDGRDWNANNLSCKAWLQEQEAAGKTVLKPADVEVIKGVAGLLPWQANCPESGLKNSALVQQGALDGLIERSLIWQQDGVWLKVRPDVLPEDANVIVDLKTTRDITKAHRSVYEYGYHMQAALVADGMERLLGRVIEATAFVFVQTSPPYPVRVVQIGPHDIAIGRQENARALNLFRRCMASGEWPAGDGDLTEARVPDWYQARLDRAAQLETAGMMEAAE